MSQRSDELIADLFGEAEARPALASTAERVADVLRGYLTEGRIAPGTRMSEEAFAKALSVSRNTLREAFRLLGHEGLLVHEMNRGVFVRTFSVDDAREIYDLREMLEVGAVRATERHTPEKLEALAATLEAGKACANVQDWQGVGTHNLEFHRQLADLFNSERVNKLMQGLLAEARLAFRFMTLAESVDGPYLSANEQILTALQAGDTEQAAVLICDYLAIAREQLLDGLKALGLT